MTEYIEREAATKALCNSEPHSCDFDTCGRLCQGVAALDSVPAADVVPVVRCKDCRFARFGPNWISCENFNGLCTTALGLEDFCSHGERIQQDGKL